MILTREQMEQRRLHFAEEIPFLSKDHSIQELATRYGVTPKTVHVWKSRLRSGQSLAKTLTPGRPPRIKRDQLLAILSDQSRSYREIREDISKCFGALYDLDYLSKVAIEAGLRRRKHAS